MSKGMQDTFIDDDDEEETCPLCVEEFDLQDKGFKPCPCGYQICQFCYNNVKNNMNGLCPACRRPYNDRDIEYKLITPEESAAHKARQAHKQKKTQQALQKEKQRAEADSLSRKHLAGLRVVQKNLVYVTGLSPTLQEDELLQTLRGDKYFGQYGNIVKIVVSKARDKQDSVGVYVTYDRKEDAQSCIKAVDGAPNADRILRAQFGTTKYCSAYLRGDTCMNRNCMFLHEPGEAGESYSRADLSALNAGSTQTGGSHNPPPQSQQPLSAAQPIHGMARLPSDQGNSPATADRPALPSHASWASKPPQTQPIQAESQAASATVGSPASRAVTPAQMQPESAAPAPVAESTYAPTPAPAPVEQTQPTPALVPSAPRPQKQRVYNPLGDFFKSFHADHLSYKFSSDGLPAYDVEVINSFPPVFEPDGGIKHKQRKQKEEEQRQQLEREQAMAHQSTVDTDENPEMSGSLQLGGEPEERPGVPQGRTMHPQAQENSFDQRFLFNEGSSPATVSERVMTPLQQQQLLLQTMKSPNASSNFLNMGQQNAFQQPAHGPGHQRNVSRFSFANDSSASAAVKPVANQKLMSQQSSMMPPTAGNMFSQTQPQGAQFYTSNVQGPPPGLKTSGTPPVSGGMTFGQGHGFTTGGPPFGTNNNANIGGNRHEDMMRDLLRGREGAAVKREYQNFPYPSQYPTNYASSMGSSFDGGDKQQRSKKKGKKHRYANTNSSSGGAGLVDASDAHLLQARLQHSAAALGGQHFGGMPPAAGGMYNPALHGGNGYGGRWQ